MANNNLEKRVSSNRFGSDDRDDLIARMGSSGFVSSIIKEIEEKKKYFNSEEFKKYFQIISQQESIDQEELKYDKVTIPGLNIDDFTKVCNSIYQKFEKDCIIDERKNGFGSVHIDYQGVRFNLCIGQGSSYSTSRIDKSN